MSNREETIQKQKKINFKKLGITVFVVTLVLLILIYYVDKNFYNKIFITTQLKNAPSSSAELSVHYIDVGQGDCSLIICNGKTVLIDTGDKFYSKKVIDYIKSQNITRLDFIIISHPHLDHIGGLEDIINSFQVGDIYMQKLSDGNLPTDYNYNDFIDKISRKCVIKSPVTGEKIDLQSATLEFIVPSATYENLNNISIVTKLTHGDNSFLFTGDIESQAEKEILDSNANISAKVIKIAHHGSNTSSAKEFIDKVNPEICVISCGAGNLFNHPSDKVIALLNKYTKKIFRTDLFGNIVIESNGRKLSYKFEKSDSNVFN